MAELKNGFTAPEIEQAAISCLMQWPEQAFTLVDQYEIKPSHFLDTSNRHLFEVLSSFFREGKPIELISFTNHLRNLGLLDKVGGAYYVTQTWCNTCYSFLAFDYYLGLIEDDHAKRLVASVGTGIGKSVSEPLTDSESLVVGAVSDLSAIPLPSRHKKATRTIAQAVQEKLHRMENGEVDEDVIKTGLSEIDYYSPLRRGDMPIIAGQRKSGKSILSLTIAINIARRKIGVLYFSLEDREPKVMDRIMASVSRLSLGRHHVEKLNPDEHIRAQSAANEIEQLPIYIKDDAYELAKIVSVTREYKARHDVGLVVVDYGQLVKTPETKEKNREQRVAEVSRTLRLLAMELDTPIIVLSQLNMEGYTRDSRSLEQDCTACWTIEAVEDEPNIRAIRIPFQRNGQSGIGFKVTFLGEIARVENHEKFERASLPSWHN